MKKILTIALAVACSFTACDIERLPYDKYSADKITEDKEASLDILLNGCYAQLKGWSDVMHRVGEYAGDNMMIRGSSTDAFYTFISYQHTPSNYRLNTFWNNSYKVISQASDLMKLVEEGENSEVDQRIGEAYYLRGTMYFYLCRAYGRPYFQSPEKNLGVPIVNGLPEDLNNLVLPDRATVKDTYAQAIADLRKGESLMTENKTAAYATKEAAQAMLSRVYMYMSGTYQNLNTTYADSSIYYAQQVIKSGRYQLLDRETFMKYNTFSPEDGAQTETIFAVKRVSSEYSGDDHYYGIGGMYANIDGVGWGEMYASAKYMELLDETGRGKDARSAFIVPQYVGQDDNKKVEAFRFIKDVYNTSGVQTNYNYVQSPLKYNADGSLYVEITEQVDKKDVTTTYQLPELDKEQGYYSINYKGKIYKGVKDYMMLLNRVYPMFYIYKCSKQEGESHLHSPIISRLAELYLNMAECYAKKGDYANALINLNIIRERSLPGEGYSSLNAANAAQLIEKERQLELAYEAERSFDVFRNGGTLTRHYPGPHNAMEEISSTDSRVIQFIPQDQINAYSSINCTLTQNP